MANIPCLLYTSEFNIAADPEAAACVFRSGIEIVMCGLDVTNQAILTPDYLATLPELNRTGKMLHALFSHYRSGSMQSGLRIDVYKRQVLVNDVPNMLLFLMKRLFISPFEKMVFDKSLSKHDILDNTCLLYTSRCV